MKQLTSPFLWVFLLAFGLATAALAPRPVHTAGAQTAQADLPASTLPYPEPAAAETGAVTQNPCSGATWPNLPAGCTGGDTPVRTVRIVR